jgi:hypothetical protein
MIVSTEVGGFIIAATQRTLVWSAQAHRHPVQMMVIYVSPVDLPPDPVVWKCSKEVFGELSVARALMIPMHS